MRAKLQYSCERVKGNEGRAGSGEDMGGRDVEKRSLCTETTSTPNHYT